MSAYPGSKKSRSFARIVHYKSPLPIFSTYCHNFPGGSHTNYSLLSSPSVSVGGATVAGRQRVLQQRVDAGVTVRCLYVAVNHLANGRTLRQRTDSQHPRHIGGTGGNDLRPPAACYENGGRAALICIPGSDHAQRYACRCEGAESYRF